MESSTSQNLICKCSFYLGFVPERVTARNSSTLFDLYHDPGIIPEDAAVQVPWTAASAWSASPASSRQPPTDAAGTARIDPRAIHCRPSVTFERCQVSMFSDTTYRWRY